MKAPVGNYQSATAGPIYYSGRRLGWRHTCPSQPLTVGGRPSDPGSFQGPAVVSTATNKGHLHFTKVKGEERATRTDAKLAIPGSPDFYRRRAVEMLNWARETRTPEIRAELLSLAQNWEHLAQTVEHLRRDLAASSHSKH